MATHITQSESNNGHTTFRVTGEMMQEDALLLEKLVNALGLSDQTVTIDLADLDFLDSDSAPVLRRLSSRDDVAIEGMEIFLQSVVDDVERR